MGANKNCMNENDASSMPRIAPIILGWSGYNGVRSRNAYKGNSGSTIPKPSKSTNTTKKTTNRADLRERSSGNGGSARSEAAAAVGMSKSAIGGFLDEPAEIVPSL